MFSMRGYFAVVGGRHYRLAMTSPLPGDVRRFLDHLAKWAEGYSNHLKWNEVDKLKGELMNNRARWQHILLVDIKKHCLDAGMRTEDVDTIMDLVSRRQAGRRLVPSTTYRNYAWPSTQDGQRSRP
jgi:hypothetical protein